MSVVGAWLRRCAQALALLALLVIGWTGYQVFENLGIEKIPARDRSLELNVNSNQVLLSLSEGRAYDRSILADVETYVGRRFDTSDFRLQSLTRIVYRYRDDLLAGDYERIRDIFLNFKYWMDQPGSDAMCYWSENHQLLFATAEFLAGQYWPNEVFSNTGLRGSEHRAMARDRLLIWLEQRWLYGFTEWYSNTYYVEDIAPLANLIDFADDPEIAAKATIVLDLLLYDLATQSWRGRFVSSSGRMYATGKRFPERNSMQAVIDHIWDPAIWGREPATRVGMDLNFVQAEKYEVPAVIRAIGADPGTSVIRASQGLDLDELVAADLVGPSDEQIMMQLAMEGFSNPEVIANTVAYVDRHGMLGSEFIYDLRHFNLDVLRLTGALPALSRVLNPVTNGVVIQRANTYTYRDPHYMVASAQAYHPGSFGDQQHLWNALLPNDISIFVTHPAAPLSASGALAGSPGYWVGSGRFPHVVQDRAIVLNVFQPPAGKGFMEKSVQDYSHAHFPADRFDEIDIDGRYAFGRAGDSYAALITANPVRFAAGTQYDLIQPGMNTYWIFEAGSVERDGSFAEFVQRIRSNPVSFEQGQLRYSSTGRELSLDYQGAFRINGAAQSLEYDRFDSPWAKAPRKPGTIRIAHGEAVLELDFYQWQRRSRGAAGPSPR